MSTAFAEMVTSGQDFQPRYDLTDPKIGQITEAYLNNPDNNLPEGRFVGVLVDYDTEIANVARTTERKVFQEVFPSNDAEFMKAEYHEIEDDSRFFMVLDRQENRAAGVIRVQDKPGREGDYKSLKDAVQEIGKTTEEVYEYHNVNPEDKAWDILTLAALPEYRGANMTGAKVTSMLYRMFNTQAKREGVQNTYAIIDEKALRATRAIGIPMMALCGIEQPFEYLDSKRSYAVYGKVTEFWQGVYDRAQDLRENTKLRDIFDYGFDVKRGIKNYVKHRALAKVAGNLAMGTGLDEHIVLPALPEAA
jgi:hypothetical protein